MKAAAVGLFGAGLRCSRLADHSRRSSRAAAASGTCSCSDSPSPFNDALGVSGGAYGWGHLYNDEYLWATVSGYATRFRPDLGYIEYCSHEYDVASWEYLRHILVTFPADM